MYYIYGKISKIIYFSTANFNLAKIAYKNYLKHYKHDELVIFNKEWNEVTQCPFY